MIDTVMAKNAQLLVILTKNGIVIFCNTKIPYFCGIIKLKKLNMKKVLLSAALIVAVAFGANAQKEDGAKLKFSVGLEAALPVGTFGDAFSFGIGGTAQANYNVSEGLDLTLNSGFLSYSVKSSVGSGSLSFIPVLAGAQYNFTEKVYGSAQLGVIFVSASGGGSSESDFTFAPGVGYKFTPNLDALLKYTSVSTTGSSAGSIGVRVAYTF